MDPDKIAWITGVIVIILSALMEHLSKNIKPWTFIFQWIGKAINKETLEKLDVLDKRIRKLEEADINQEKLRQESEAKEARRRIIMFADELRRNINHSPEAFDNILDDVSYYKNYCREHPTFKNEKAVRSISIIDESYDKCMHEDNFL